MTGSLMAQARQLPYKNFMSTTQEKNDLVSVRTGSTATYDWSVNTTLGYASHDYPVGGSSTDTVSDWLFTPPIKVSATTVLSFKYWVYGITGNVTPADEFSVWFGKSSRNPNNGTFVKIADLTNKVATNFNWRDTSGIQIPFSADSGYICFRYRATNNWFTLGLDSIVLTEPGLSIKEIVSSAFSSYPNPANDRLTFTSVNPIYSIELINIHNQIVHSGTYTGTQSGEMELSAVESGYYILKVITSTGTLYRRLLVE